MTTKANETEVLDEKASRPADKDNAEALDTLTPEPEQTQEAPKDKSKAKRPADKDVKLESDEITIDDSKEAALVNEQSIPSTELSEDINGLLESLELEGEFKEKAKTIFEAAVAGRVSDLHKAMLEANTVAMTEYKTSLEAKLQEQVDTYLAETVSKWLQENEVAVKSNIRVQLAESFMANLADLLEKHYITVPEGKEDVLEAALEKVEALETALAEQVEETSKAKATLAEHEKELAFASITESLTDTKKARVKELSESIDKKLSLEDFKKKLECIVEGLGNTTQAQTTSLTEDVNGEVDAKTNSEESASEELKETMDPEVAALVAGIRNLNSY